MNNKTGLLFALIGIAILAFSIYLTAKNQTNNMPFLQPIGTLFAVGGSLFHIMKNQKKKEDN